MTSPRPYFVGLTQRDFETLPTSQNPVSHKATLGCSYCGIITLVKALKVCGKCKAMPYCSKECQRSDWNNHRNTCRGVGLTEGDRRSRLTLKLVVKMLAIPAIMADLAVHAAHALELLEHPENCQKYAVDFVCGILPADTHSQFLHGLRRFLEEDNYKPSFKSGGRVQLFVAGAHKVPLEETFASVSPAEAEIMGKRAKPDSNVLVMVFHSALNRISRDTRMAISSKALMTREGTATLFSRDRYPGASPQANLRCLSKSSLQDRVAFGFGDRLQCTFR